MNFDKGNQTFNIDEEKNEIIERISKTLQIPLSIESSQEDMIQLSVTGEDYTNDYDFITFLRTLIKDQLVEKIQYEKNNEVLKVSFILIKKNLNDEKIKEILETIENEPYLINDYDYGYDIKNLTTNLSLLLLGLRSNGIIEYDVLHQMLTFRLKDIDAKTFPLNFALGFIDSLNKNPKCTKKFINGGNCDINIKERITSPEEAHEAALAYSEKNESLCELLEFCFNNNIWTTACCKGHSNSDGFVTFNLNYENTENFFLFLASKLLGPFDLLLDSNGTQIKIPKYPTCTLHIYKYDYTGGTILYPFTYTDQILQHVLECAKEYTETKNNLPSPKYRR